MFTHIEYRHTYEVDKTIKFISVIENFKTVEPNHIAETKWP